MAKIKTLKELRKFILYLEDKYDLLDFEIDGVNPWQLMRVHIDYNLGEILGIMSSPDTKLGILDKVINAIGLLKSYIFKNPFLSSKVDTVIFSNSRVKQVDNEYIDIYTHYFIDELSKSNKNFIEIEAPHKGKHLTKNKPYKYHMEFVWINKKLFNIFIKIKNKKENEIEKIENEIEQNIGKYDLKNIFYKSVREYKIEYFLYKNIFKKLNPSKVYLVVSYGFGAMIKAAKDLGIETIEFQHGNFSEYHYGYYFGEDKKELDYFPDKFYVWNEYWKNHINFPIDDKNIVIKQFDYLESRKTKYKHIEKVKNRAVVLSQGVLADRIAQKILDNWGYFKHFELIYKLHPGEYERYQKYTHLNKLIYMGAKVVTDVDLYELFSSCEFQIGVFSTALYEGVEFGCKTIMLNLEGAEEMDRFRKIYEVELI